MPVTVTSSPPPRLLETYSPYCDPLHGHRDTGVRKWTACSYCTGEYKHWSTFYVVLNPVTSVIKIGISTGLARNRLGDHRGQGYTCIVRLMSSPWDTEAPLLETDVLDMLRKNQITPMWGREYFPLTALPLILQMIDDDDTWKRRGFRPQILHTSTRRRV